MSYELVDAVNQQCVLKGRATDLLILTKFAELVSNPAVPKQRISLERFKAMTRLDRSTVQRHLHSLHDCGLLVCLDGDKVKGDKPKLYQLNLPEGFDRNVVNARRRKYYGGEPFIPEYYEDNSMFDAGGGLELSPVPSGGLGPDVPAAAPQTLGNLPQTLGNLPQTLGNLPRKQGAMPPLNNKRTKNNNNNKGVVVDEEVGFVLKKAAKATGGKEGAFSDLGITSDNAKIAIDAIRKFNERRNKNPDFVTENPVAYLRKLIAKALSSNGDALSTGSLDPQPEKDQVMLDIEMTWQDFLLDGHKLNTLGTPRSHQLWKELTAYLRESPYSEGPKLVKEFVERFNAANPNPPKDPDELFAAIQASIR